MMLFRGSTPGRYRCVSGLGLAAIWSVALMCEQHAVASAPAGYNLVWSDEFNQGVGASPNSANWTFDTGAGG